MCIYVTLGVVGAVGKISAFQPQGPQFAPPTDLCDFLSRLS